MNLFILLMDGGGSRLLSKYLEKCEKVVTLSVGEGQQLFGSDGPDMHDAKYTGCFVRYAQQLSDPNSYNWPNIIEKWKKDWGWKDDNKVYLEKCPCDIFRIDQILKHFPDFKLIIGTRNPYAVLEGKLRIPGVDVEEATKHWLTLAYLQKQILEKYEEQSLRLRYEDICDDPQESTEKIKKFIPQLADFTLQGTTKIASGIRETKERPLLNMNFEKKLRLKITDINKMSKVIMVNGMVDLLDFWEYRLWIPY